MEVSNSMDAVGQRLEPARYGIEETDVTAAITNRSTSPSATPGQVTEVHIDD